MVAYTVAQRTREIAVRMAVGAQVRDVIHSVLDRGLRAVVIGLVIGMAGAMALAQVMTVVLYGVSPADPLTYALVAAVLLGAALLACLVPTRRALRLDPVVALRAE